MGRAGQGCKRNYTHKVHIKQDIVRKVIYATSVCLMPELLNVLSVVNRLLLHCVPKYCARFNML